MPGAKSSAVHIDISGDGQTIKIIRQMRTTRGRRAMSAGAFAATGPLMKAAKAAIPSRYKKARKGIGRRRLKVKEAKGGGAKVGAKVGRASKFNRAGREAGRKGVGIGARNIHWLLAGTGALHQPDPNPARVTGKKGGPVRHTGSTAPVMPPMWALALQNKTQMNAEFKKAAWKDIQASIEQGKAFA